MLAGSKVTPKLCIHVGPFLVRGITLRAALRNCYFSPTFEARGIGFRAAEVPEATSPGCVVAGNLALPASATPFGVLSLGERSVLGRRLVRGASVQNT